MLSNLSLILQLNIITEIKMWDALMIGNFEVFLKHLQQIALINETQ